MENYTKYKLKAVEELAPYLDGTDRVFVLACNKCFKEFETLAEPECAELVKIATERGKTITGTANVDFLCNKTQTEKKLKLPEGTKGVFVISCGLGVQTVASMVDVPVYTATNTLNYTGHHGMALTQKSCDACAQCYLNITGGVCPIVDCSKSLVNGQCGGAKAGKCEIDPNKDCAWQKIYERLEAQGRLEEFLKQPIQFRDYNKTNFKVINEFVKAARDSRFAGYYGGIHPVEGKEPTERKPLVKFPSPKTAVFPMSMHLGAPAKPIVAVGDTVKVGQKIAEAGGFISAPVHSSISGKVVAIEERPHAISGKCMAIVVESDGKDTLHESVKPNKPLDQLTPDEIVEIIKEAGIAGMGGAGFPTCVKLKPGKPIDAVLINGCECEPRLTADHRVLLEFADEIVFGIEDNKPDAIELMKAKVEKEEGLEVVVARTKYPQGGEKMLIKRVLGRTVPSGKLPADVGALVGNASTVKAISDAIQKGMPLIERATTVTGPYIKEPNNFLIKIGTSAAELVEACGGILPGDVMLKAGGPMMGFAQKDVNFPLMKGSNGVLALDNDHTQPVACIKCGRCVDVCPMELAPLQFSRCHDAEDWVGMKAYNVMDCMECRCCESICSSKIPLLSKIKAGKAAVRGMK